MAAACNDSAADWEMTGVFMIGKALSGNRTRHAAVLVPGLAGAAASPPQPASAADCPGHPDALGTSRTLVVDPREHPRIGTMQYARNPAAAGITRWC